MNANQQLLLQYLLDYSKFTEEGGMVALTLPPGGCDRTVRRQIEAKCSKVLANFQWLDGAVIANRI
jgi:hypothetical protein